jgi:hypothetical protein
MLLAAVTAPLGVRGGAKRCWYRRSRSFSLEASFDVDYLIVVTTPAR